MEIGTRIKLRMDDANVRHTRFTVFEDGASCGQLTMTTMGFQRLVIALKHDHVQSLIRECSVTVGLEIIRKAQGF